MDDDYKVLWHRLKMLMLSVPLQTSKTEILKIMTRMESEPYMKELRVEVRNEAKNSRIIVKG